MNAVCRACGFHTWAAGLLVSVIAADAISATPLNSQNWSGVDGAHYWNITAPGEYYLAIPEAVFATEYEHAIRVLSSNVTIDGKGKTITGSGIPVIPIIPGKPGVYGVRINGGRLISNIRVKNLMVTNKFYGVIFEYVDRGRVENVRANKNAYGLTIWKTNATTIGWSEMGNNTRAGINCDSNKTRNESNYIINNNAHHNGESGIALWASCVNNYVQGNISNANTGMGIALTSGADGNTISGNTLDANSSGIWVSKSIKNIIASNKIRANKNVGVYLAANGNQVSGNVIQENGNAGVWLSGSSGTAIRENSIIYNKAWGIFLAKSSGQQIENNFFRNQNNVGVSYAGPNSWNALASAGPNIASGPKRGGNFWGSTTAPGISETNSDVNCDGFLDEPFVVADGNLDRLPLHLGDISRKLVAADFNKDGISDLAALTSAGTVQFSTTFRGWELVPGIMNKLYAGDVNGDGRADLVGLSYGGTISFSTDLKTWRALPGRWNEVVIADFDNNRRADLAAITHGGEISVTLDLSHWVRLNGSFQRIVAGQFNGDGRADLAAITSAGVINYSTDLKTWRAIPGVFNQFAAGDLSGDGRSDFAALTSKGVTGYTTDLQTWTTVGGTLTQVALADLNGDRRAEVIGLTQNGQVSYYASDLRSWKVLPRTLSQLTFGDFNKDGRADIAGLTKQGVVNYTTNLTSWAAIPGTFASVCK